MKITDGKRTVEITMRDWDGAQWGADYANDFFDLGAGVAEVDDIEYCIEYAETYANRTNTDFEYTGNEPETLVEVNDIDD